MEIDGDIFEAVSVALTKGQGKYTKEEITQAYEQVIGDMIAGDLAGLVILGQLHLVIDDGVVKYGTPEDSSVEELISRLHGEFEP